MEMFTLDGGDKKMLIFPTGRVYKCNGDLLTECKPKIEICIEPKTLKVYKYAYIHFECTKHSLAKLVAQAFIENPDNHQFVQRINGDATDNSAENLRWVADRRQFKRVSREQILALPIEKLGPCNRAVYQLLIHGDESGVLQLVTRQPMGGSNKSNLYRYLYESLAKQGIPAEERELRMDEGYELLKRRLLAYYLPHEGMLGEGRFRKYCYFCYLYNALDKRNKVFIPRELRRPVASDEVFDYL